MTRKILLFVAAAVLFSAGPARAAVELQSYQAVFKPLPDGSGRYRDVAVELTLTFDATGTSVSRGFKFVGKNRVKGVRVTDEGGDIPFTVENLAEKKISFTFPEVRNGLKTVLLSFIIEDALSESGVFSEFDASWAGNWKIPVQSGTCVFVLPPGYRNISVSSKPSSFRKENRDGSTALVFEPPAGMGLTVKLFPSINVWKLMPFLGALLISLVYVIAYSVVRMVRIPSSQAVDSHDPSPAELAFIARDMKHAYAVVVFDLLQKGMLAAGADKTLVAVQKSGYVRSYEYPILGFFRQPQRITDLYADKELNKTFEQGILDELAKKGCVNDRQAEKAAGWGIIRICLFSAVMVTVVGWTSSAIGSFVILFALFLFVVAVFLVCGINHAFRRKHISRRGKEMVDKYTYRTNKGEHIMADKTAYSEGLTYAVAVLGLGILEGTVYGSLLDHISYSRMVSSNTSAGCSGCSAGTSGGDGGGGDSGGCGGCGGGD